MQRFRVAKISPNCLWPFSFTNKALKELIDELMCRSVFAIEQSSLRYDLMRGLTKRGRYSIIASGNYGAQYSHPRLLSGLSGVFLFRSIFSFA